LPLLQQPLLCREQLFWLEPALEDTVAGALAIAKLAAPSYLLLAAIAIAMTMAGSQRQRN